MFQLNATEWCFPCDWHRAEPGIPAGVYFTIEERRQAWVMNPPRLMPAFTTAIDPETERLRELENARREAIKSAKRESLNSFKDEHADRGEKWDAKAKAWVRDEKLLKRMREAEFRQHAAELPDADIAELQQEPIESRASGEAPSHKPAPTGATVTGAALGSSLSGRYRTAAPVSTSPKGDKRREVVAMPVVMPPLPPKL